MTEFELVSHKAGQDFKTSNLGEFIQWMEGNGYKVTGSHESPRTHQLLQGLPVFDQIHGPMYEGRRTPPRFRWETWAVAQSMSMKERGTKMTTKKFGAMSDYSMIGAYEAGKQYGFDYWHKGSTIPGRGFAFPTGPDRDTAWAEYAAKNLAGVAPAVQSSMKAEFFTGYFAGRQKYNELTDEKKRRVSPTPRPPNRVDRSLLPKMREQGDKKFGADAKAQEWDDGYSEGYDRGKDRHHSNATAAPALKQYEAERQASSPLGPMWLAGFKVGYHEARSHYYGGTEVPNSLTVVDNVLSYARYSERTGHRTKKFEADYMSTNPYVLGIEWGEIVKVMVSDLEADSHRTDAFDRRVNPDDQYGIEHQWGFFVREYHADAVNWTPDQKAKWGRGYSSMVMLSERTSNRMKKFAHANWGEIRADPEFQAATKPLEAAVMEVDDAYTAYVEARPVGKYDGSLRDYESAVNAFEKAMQRTRNAYAVDEYQSVLDRDKSWIQIAKGGGTLPGETLYGGRLYKASERTPHRFVAPRGLFG